MKLYNTLTRQLEEFTPRDPKQVTMYVCGPTVYDVPHIGHARSAYVFDVLRRYLTFKGFGVRFVRNVTDVDDKIIEKARQELAVSSQQPAASNLKAKCAEVSQRYLKSYHEVLERLGIEVPTKEPLATAHVVPEMADLISKLLMQGVAYEANGDVYFAVRKFEGYGKLSNRTLDELKAGARVEPGEGKQDPLDFALWKAAKPGEPSWPSPWGEGRPGWHIECSAMSTKYLGDTFDIHGGGVDLVFPHHENEIAQAQAAGKPFARLWIHNGLLTVGGEKMSKSLNNFINVPDALVPCSGETDALKVFFLGTHYRSPIDYNTRNMKAALARYRRILNFCHRANNTDSMTSSKDVTVQNSVLRLQGEFISAMDDDLNTPKALAALDGLVTMGYETSDHSHRVGLAETIFHLGKSLGLFKGFVGVRLTNEQQQLLHKREEARRRGDFTTADQIRVSFAAQGLAIEDTPAGPAVLPK